MKSGAGALGAAHASELWPIEPLADGDRGGGGAGDGVRIIDQRQLPHRLIFAVLSSADEVAVAIREMWLRGAPLIGAAAAFGLALALKRDASDAVLASAAQALAATRPTAVNLAWALQRLRRVVQPLALAERPQAAWHEALRIAEEDIAANAAIGEHGLALLRAIAARKPGPVRVLTHCNAGWLATVGWGTATAPLYKAHAAGLPIEVWVDETRPRNQGASLTAWELGRAGVAHRVIADNAGGHLMQRGEVDLVIVGSDRTTATGDVCNKIGTYLKALAARAHGIPFYVALPVSSIDWTIRDGIREIPIEERSADEVRTISGRRSDGRIERIELFSAETAARNPAFDVTPAELVSGIITERGIFEATVDSLADLKVVVESSTMCSHTP